MRIVISGSMTFFMDYAEVLRICDANYVFAIGCDRWH